MDFLVDGLYAKGSVNCWEESLKNVSFRCWQTGSFETTLLHTCTAGRKSEQFVLSLGGTTGR